MVALTGGIAPAGWVVQHARKQIIPFDFHAAIGGAGCDGQQPMMKRFWGCVMATRTRMLFCLLFNGSTAVPEEEECHARRCLQQYAPTYAYNMALVHAYAYLYAEPVRFVRGAMA